MPSLLVPYFDLQFSDASMSGNFKSGILLLLCVWLSLGHLSIIKQDYVTIVGTCLLWNG